MKICIGDHPFYVSSTIDKGENKVQIEDAQPKVNDEFDDSVIMPVNKIVTDKWLDVAYFIRSRCKYNVATTEKDLYNMVLSLVVQEFSKPMIPNRYINHQFLMEALDLVIAEEPVIQNAIKTFR